MSAEGLGLKEIEVGDLSFIVELGNKTEELWLDGETKFPFDEGELEKWIGWEDKFGLVLIVDDKKIGFVLVSIDRTMAEIVAFAIKEEWRGKGYGKAAMKKVLDDIEEKGADAQMVHVGAENEKAIDFYSDLGFKEGERVVSMFRGLGGEVEGC